MYFCAAPWNHIKLNANGTWKHCCVFDSKSDKPFNGDIKDTSNHQSFKDLRKEVDTGANGTQNYVLKKGMNKNSIATTKQ